MEFVDLVSVDFRNPEAARSVINRWAKKKTKGALRLREINYAPSTKMALASSIYFKGKWVYTFEDAKPGTFFTKTGPVEAKMMNIKKKFRWGKLGNYAEWVALPYESSDSLIIILPNRQQNVDDVINLIDGNDIDEIMQGIDSESTKANVNITLPRFRLESTSSLVEPLKKVFSKFNCGIFFDLTFNVILNNFRWAYQLFSHNMPIYLICQITIQCKLITLSSRPR